MTPPTPPHTTGALELGNEGIPFAEPQKDMEIPLLWGLSIFFLSLEPITELLMHILLCLEL